MTPAPQHPAISVVIPHYDDEPGLRQVLAGLALQESTDTFEVIVADDGSAALPDPGPQPFPVQVVTHADLGNRTGSARNHGAAAARGELLVFIDGDTVPEPSFLAAIAQACEGRHLTVGRRRHADLAGMGPAQVQAWLRGGPHPPVLAEPQWLADGYAATQDLRIADARSYRFVISALLACPRELFLRLGGFAEELVGYGGEDWELARRAWLAGADLRYAPAAVGWHDGPDLAGRPIDQRAAKNRETLRIAELITDPALRGRGLLWRYPRIVVRCAPTPTDDLAGWVACAEGLLGAGDLAIWTGDGERWPLTDPRIHAGMPSRAVTGRAELIVDLARPVVAAAQVLDAWELAAPAACAGVVQVASPRDLARGTPFAGLEPPERIPHGLQLEAWFGSRHRGRDPAPAAADAAG